MLSGGGVLAISGGFSCISRLIYKLGASICQKQMLIETNKLSVTGLFSCIHRIVCWIII